MKFNKKVPNQPHYLTRIPHAGPAIAHVEWQRIDDDLLSEEFLNYQNFAHWWHQQSANLGDDASKLVHTGRVSRLTAAYVPLAVHGLIYLTELVAHTNGLYDLTFNVHPGVVRRTGLNLQDAEAEYNILVRSAKVSINRHLPGYDRVFKIIPKFEDLVATTPPAPPKGKLSGRRNQNNA